MRSSACVTLSRAASVEVDGKGAHLVVRCICLVLLKGIKSVADVRLLRDGKEYSVAMSQTMAMLLQLFLPSTFSFFGGKCPTRHIV